MKIKELSCRWVRNFGLILCIPVNCEKIDSPACRPGATTPPHQPSPFGSVSATLPQEGSDPLGARASRPHLVPAEACSRASPWPIAQTWPSTILAAGSVRRLAGAELQWDAAGRHPVGGSNIGHADRERWRRCRLIQVGEMARLCQSLCGRDARAPGKPSSHDIVRSTGQKCRSIWASLVVEGGPSVFCSIRVHLCPFVVHLD